MAPRARLLVLLAALALAACVAPPDRVTPGRDTSPRPPTAVPTSTPPSPLPAPPRTPSPTPSPSPSPDGTELRVTIERRTTDDATADFVATTTSILQDPRGWKRAGFDVVVVPDGEFRIVLAEGDEVDALCVPYDTEGTYSCQNGPIVALNAARWRSATPQWPGGLADYRTMLVNHEVGHLLHLHHPRPQCPGPGLPAPIMMQQSTELGTCTANPWPLQWEVELAAARLEPLAPPADHDVSDHRPSPPPARR